MDTKKLRQKILDLAIHGKLVPQDPNDEPASVLLERIRAEKEKLIKEGKIKAPKKSKSAGDTSHYPKDVPFEVPEGWAWTSIDDIAFVTKLAGFEYTEYIANNLTGHDGVPLFKGKNVQDGKIIYHFESFIPKEISDELPRSQVRRKCLLTPYVGTIGNIGIHDKEGFYHLGSNVGKIEILNGNQTDIYEEYVKLFLQSTSGYKELTKQKKATAQDSISIEAIREVLIPIPPRGEQQRILQEISHWLSFVESIEQAETSINDTICAAKARILELAIHGKLVPQDPSDEPAIELLKRINPDFKPSDNLHYEGSLPIGWELCRLEDILEYEQPQAYIVKSTEYSDKYITPVLTPGKTFVLGYTNESEGIYNALPVIIFDDFTTESKYVDFPFKVKSSAMKILRAKGEIDIRYVAFFMSITRLAGDTHKRYWISEYSKLYIPIPPFQEQKRIVAKIKELSMQLDLLVADTQ